MPDAATIDTAQLITNGGLVQEVLSDLVLEALYDPTDLTALMTRVPWNAGGSDTLRSTIDAAPGAYTARASEIDGSNIANAAYATGKFDLIPAGYSRRYQLTDLNLFNEARYTRHLSQADLHSPFQDHPTALEHFPSGSLARPPAAWAPPASESGRE